MERSLLEAIRTNTEELFSELVSISRTLNRHPELGLQEKSACSLLAKFLRAHGFSVETGLAGLPTSFRAEAPSDPSLPAFAFLAEYDALPGIGHGCGHNLIAASAVGAGVVLQRVLAREQPGSGRVVVLGTPAEETLGGKIPMLQRGVFSGIDAVLQLHPETANILRGTTLACDHFRFSFRGKSAHAASNPEKGINALDAVLLTFQGINALRQQLPSTTRVHGIITQGGLAANVIPEFAQAEFMVRAPSRNELEPISRRVLQCARGAALASGCRLKVEPTSFPCDEIRNNPALVRRVEQAMQRNGIEPILPEDPFPGSSDFGSISHVLPSAYAFLATAPAGVELHSRRFARSTVTPRAEEALSRMVRILAEVGAAFLLDPKLRAEVKTQFQQQTAATR